MKATYFKIVSCKQKEVWYRDCIGYTFWGVDAGSGWWRVIYEGINPPKYNQFIYREDAQVIRDADIKVVTRQSVEEV